MVLDSGNRVGADCGASVVRRLGVVGLLITGGFMEMLFLLLAWHALADYPLQGDFLARAKNKFLPIPGVPWWQALSAHCLIHAGGVYVITGSGVAAACEFFGHALTDYAKCKGLIGFNADQAIHVAMKIGYVLALAYV